MKKSNHQTHLENFVETLRSHHFRFHTVAAVGMIIVVAAAVGIVPSYGRRHGTFQSRRVGRRELLGHGLQIERTQQLWIVASFVMAVFHARGNGAAEHVPERLRGRATGNMVQEGPGIIDKGGNAAGSCGSSRRGGIGTGVVHCCCC